MGLFATILLLALTRAEIVERFRTPPAKMCEGLVQVSANCPVEMRRAYQLPVASYASRICKALYGANRLKPAHFEEPGIVVILGDVTTNLTNVVSRAVRRADGTTVTRILLPAPGYADMRTFTAEIARGFFRAVKREEPDLETALAAYRRTDPAAAVRDKQEALRAWREDGVYSEGRDDEDYLKLTHAVLWPGQVTHADVLQFAARLYLYPIVLDAPFAGRYTGCDFREAVSLAKIDPAVRFAAYRKALELPVQGGGRGAAMAEAAEAYGGFLMALARGEKGEDELLAELDAAEAKLKGVLE